MNSLEVGPHVCGIRIGFLKPNKKKSEHCWIPHVECKKTLNFIYFSFFLKAKEHLNELYEVKMGKLKKKVSIKSQKDIDLISNKKKGQGDLCWTHYNEKSQKCNFSPSYKN
jgi:hypothetical protein